MTAALKHEISECLTCGKPLGFDSKEEGYPVCQICRKCDICSEDVPAREIDITNPDNITVRHDRCWIVKRHKDLVGKTDETHLTINQKDLDIFNAATIMNPNMDLSKAANVQHAELTMYKHIEKMNHEQIGFLLRQMEACVAIGREYLHKTAHKSLEQIEKESNTRKSREFNKLKEVEKVKNLETELEKAEKIKNLKGVELSKHIRDKNYQEFLVRLGLKDEKASERQFDGLVSLMKQAGIVKSVEDSKTIIFTDKAFERAFGILGLTQVPQADNKSISE